MSGPVPGTPTPWSQGWEGTICWNGEWAEIPLPFGWTEGAWTGAEATDESRANAAAIVHRVNHWDALEAERDALKARVAALVEAGRNLIPYLDWAISDESPGHHPTMPSAVAAFKAALSLAKGEQP